MNNTRPLTVCYMGLTKPGFSRNGVQIQALRSVGVIVHECFDESPGVSKFVRLYQKHAALNGAYDVVIVGYPSALVVPFARFISRKPVIFDAAWSLYEGIVLARRRFRINILGRLVVWLIDRLGYQTADLVLLDTNEQLDFYASLMKVSKKKLRRLYTGCDEKAFFADPSVRKRSRFTAVFRGKYNIEAGLPHVLAAGKLLKDEGIDLIVYSPGYHPKKEELSENVTVVSDFLSFPDLRTALLECHVSIGQMDNNDRLNHSIPHKAFEALHMKIPYIAARARAVEELFTDGGNCLMVEPGNAHALAVAILKLRDENGLSDRLVENGLETYQTKASWQAIGTELQGYAKELLP
jgi:glycosyltransferase involved in cell wall biosynthesis